MIDLLIQTSLGLKLIYIFGILNIVSIVLIYFSCRCFIQPKIFQKLVSYSWYRWFYKQHCRLWWIFFTSVIVHTIIAFILVGNPLANK